MNPKFDILRTVPFPAEKIKWECIDGAVTISYPRFKHAWLNVFLPKYKSRYLHITLEKYGSCVWTLIDGERTVEEIIQKVKLAFPDEEDLEARVSLYIGQLHRDGFVKLCERMN